jgi:signal transduction histidine kinase
MAEGAQDYLIKGQIESRALPRALRHAIERYRMQRETEALRINQMQFKDEFLSHVSHELRSPLAAIYQFVTILLDRLAGELEPKQHQYLEVVLRNVKQLQSMINDLLEVTRMQAGKLTIEVQSTSIADAIGYAVNTLQGAADAKGVNLSADAGSELALLPFVCADPTRLRQILIILLDNAIKFTPTNGVVKVRARIPKASPGSLRLEVSDTGCGISPHLTERIFERLFQAADPASAGRKGLGLGLYICKDLVTRQGGRIWVENAPHKAPSSVSRCPCFPYPIWSTRLSARQDARTVRSHSSWRRSARGRAGCPMRCVRRIRKASAICCSDVCIRISTFCCRRSAQRARPSSSLSWRSPTRSAPRQSSRGFKDGWVAASMSSRPA